MNEKDMYNYLRYLSIGGNQISGHHKTAQEVIDMLCTFIGKAEALEILDLQQTLFTPEELEKIMKQVQRSNSSI